MADRYRKGEQKKQLNKIINQKIKVMETTTKQTSYFCKNNTYFQQYVLLANKIEAEKMKAPINQKFHQNFRNGIEKRAKIEFDNNFKKLKSFCDFMPIVGIFAQFSKKIKFNIENETYKYIQFTYTCEMDLSGNWSFSVYAPILYDFDGFGWEEWGFHKPILSQFFKIPCIQVPYNGILNFNELDKQVILFIESKRVIN